MNIIISKASWVKAALFTVFFIAMYVLINNTAVGVAGLLQITGGANILDFFVCLSAGSALKFLNAIGQQGRLFFPTPNLSTSFIFPPSSIPFHSG